MVVGFSSQTQYTHRMEDRYLETTAEVFPVGKRIVGEPGVDFVIPISAAKHTRFPAGTGAGIAAPKLSIKTTRIPAYCR